MKLLWNVVKVALALMIALPLAIIVLGTTIGLFGAVLGLALVALRVALIGLVAYGAFRLVARLMRGPRKPAPPPRQVAAPAPDPYFEAAMRELDRDIGNIR